MAPPSPALPPPILLLILEAYLQLRQELIEARQEAYEARCHWEIAKWENGCDSARMPFVVQYQKDEQQERALDLSNFPVIPLLTSSTYLTALFTPLLYRTIHIFCLSQLNAFMLTPDPANYAHVIHINLRSRHTFDVGASWKWDTMFWDEAQRLEYHGALGRLQERLRGIETGTTAERGRAATVDGVAFECWDLFDSFGVTDLLVKEQSKGRGQRTVPSSHSLLKHLVRYLGSQQTASKGSTTSLTLHLTDPSNCTFVTERVPNLALDALTSLTLILEVETRLPSMVPIPWLTRQGRPGEIGQRYAAEDLVVLLEKKLNLHVEMRGDWGDGLHQSRHDRLRLVDTGIGSKNGSPCRLQKALRECFTKEGGDDLNATAAHWYDELYPKPLNLNGSWFLQYGTSGLALGC